MWSSQFALGANNWIYTIATAPNGDIYVAGDFTQIAGVSASHVAHWSANPGQWSSLRTGLSNRVSALALSGKYLSAAGYFLSAGGSPVNDIARWNLTMDTWPALGTGLAHAVTGATGRALAAYGSGGVYVDGQFDSAGGVLFQNIAQRTSSAWTGLGEGVGYTQQQRKNYWEYNKNLFTIIWLPRLCPESPLPPRSRPLVRGTWLPPNNGLELTLLRYAPQLD